MLTGDWVAIDTFEIWLPDELQELFTDSVSSFLVIHSRKSDGFKTHLSKELWGSG